MLQGISKRLVNSLAKFHKWEGKRMADKRKDQGMLEGAVEKSKDMMQELGTELGLTEQPKESKRK